MSKMLKMMKFIKYNIFKYEHSKYRLGPGSTKACKSMVTCTCVII